jgi:hypothetical protein
MSERYSHVVWAGILCAVVLVLVLDGGRWLWHFILIMHGMH